jgi:hypothetical protein
MGFWSSQLISVGHQVIVGGVFPDLLASTGGTQFDGVRPHRQGPWLKQVRVEDGDGSIGQVLLDEAAGNCFRI